MTRSILTLSTLALLAALTVPVVADEMTSNNDVQPNLRTSEGVTKLFRDHTSNQK